MATTLSPEHRQGGVKLNTKGGMLKVRETYFYFVKTDDKDTTRLEVLQTPGLPIPGVTVSPTNMGICVACDVERSEKNPLIWTATVEFSSDLQDDGSGGNPNSNPETWVPEYETFLDPAEEAITRDRDGKPYINGAGVPYEEAPMAPYDNLRWDFFQIEPLSVDDATIASRNNTTNSAVFRGHAIHTLLLKVRRSVVGTYYGAARRLVEYSIIWNQRNWHDKLPNVGNQFLFKGKYYPYRYITDPETVVENGPLGAKDYLFGDTLDERAGLPTATGKPLIPDPPAPAVPDYSDIIVMSGGVPFAVPPTEKTLHSSGAYFVYTPVTKLFWIERRRFNSLDFNTFLRS